MNPDLIVDRTGFPMYWVDALDAYVHWLPVTKVQFETFLGDRPLPRFDQVWYDTLLRLNRRIAPRQIEANNYWQAFLTGVKPDEAQMFAEWSGENGDGQYALPTRQEWFAAYNALKALPTRDLARDFQRLALAPRASTIVEKLEGAAAKAWPGHSPRTLADQMLLRLGVMEWVECKGNRLPWGAMGSPNKQFASGLNRTDQGEPSLPNDLDQRIRSYGFRLLRRSA